MENLIKEKLRENLNEVSQHKEYPAYHGSNTRITQFKDEFAGAIEAADADGPGIYFTNSYMNGIMWGKYIHKVILRPRKVISNETLASDVNREDLMVLLNAVEDYTQNWSEDLETDKEMAIDAAIEYSDTADEVFHSIRSEQFVGRPQTFMRTLTKLGYDMLYLKKTELTGITDVDVTYHYVVYNPAIIEVRGIKEISTN